MIPMLGAPEAQLSKGPYMLGERMTAADVLWGVAFSWTMMFGIVPKKDVFVRYAERIDLPAGVPVDHCGGR